MGISKNDGAVAEKSVSTPVQPQEDSVNKYVNADQAKSVRILRQGVYQAVLHSPGIAGLPYANEEQYLALVKSVSEKVIKLIEGN